MFSNALLSSSQNVAASSMFIPDLADQFGIYQHEAEAIRQNLSNILQYNIKVRCNLTKTKEDQNKNKEMVSNKTKTKRWSVKIARI